MTDQIWNALFILICGVLCCFSAHTLLTYPRVDHRPEPGDSELDAMLEEIRRLRE